MFYEKDEIDAVKAIQRMDPFNDVLEDRDEIFTECDGPKNLTRQNKFNIMDYMPKPDVVDEKDAKKSNKPTAE